MSTKKKRLSVDELVDNYKELKKKSKPESTDKNKFDKAIKKVIKRRSSK